MRKFSISIYFLVPFIFGLFSILTCLVSFQVIDYCLFRNHSPRLFMTLATLVLSSVSALIGYLIIRFVLKPAELFIEKARLSPAVKIQEGEATAGNTSLNQMESFTRIFDQVAQALDVLDAETLFPEIIGKSRAMRQVLSQVIKVAHTNSTVLLLGESGTGKELIAQGIVAQSPRRDNPFIRINCAAITPTLMESELFGHERGAFTGAIGRKKGCFEQAHTGTLFLDEIGDMPLELQAKLLRVIQERSFYRVGGTSSVTVDVRIIAATNKNLGELVAQGNFREDLFYRINVFPIFLPPLRKMADDVKPLALHFLVQTSPGKSFDDPAMDILEKYAWPGNVRELENVVERAALLAGEDDLITSNHLPPGLKSSRTLALSMAGQGAEGFSSSLEQTLQEIEKSLICEALKNSSGVQTAAAEKLGINQRSLWNRVKKYDIDVNTFKSTNQESE